jgi:hypothetical protein
MYQLFLSDFNEFFRHIFEKFSNFMKIRPMVAEFIEMDDRQPEMTKLIVAFL